MRRKKPIHIINWILGVVAWLDGFHINKYASNKLNECIIILYEVKWDCRINDGKLEVGNCWRKDTKFVHNEIENQFMHNLNANWTIDVSQNPESRTNRSI